MRAVHRTISLPQAVVVRLQEEAKRRHMSLSAMVTELIECQPAPLPYAALFDDDPDLSVKVREVRAGLDR